MLLRQKRDMLENTHGVGNNLIGAISKAHFFGQIEEVLYNER